jgi:hypothetical protein
MPLFEGLSDEIKNSPSRKEYAASLEKIKNLSTGATAPDFTQNTTDGKPLKLSDFRGKYLLVDFWKS